MRDTRLKMLRFRAWRRGFREFDLIMGPFADRFLAGLNDAEVDAFEVLLDQADQDVYAWITGVEPTPAAFAGGLMDRLQAFRLIESQAPAPKEH